MTNCPEKTLIEALQKVDVHGDVAPPHVHDPMTMVLRENDPSRSNALGRRPRPSRVDRDGPPANYREGPRSWHDPSLQEARRVARRCVAPETSQHRF